MKSRTLLVSALALSASNAVLPAEQSTPASATAQPDIFQVQTLEEVVVTGKLSTLGGLSKAIVEAESRFFDRFNELNKDRSMDIQCRVEAPTGTRLKHRNCHPQAVDDLTRAQALGVVGVQEGNVNLTTAADIQAQMQPVLKKRTLELLKQDPELLRALLEHARLVQMYEDMRAKKFAEHTLVWD